MFYSSEDAFSVLDKIKNTPRYWKQVRNELIGKLVSVGPFTFFFTLSCADKRWMENTSILADNHKIEYEIIDEVEKVFVDCEPLEDFLNKNEVTPDEKNSDNIGDETEKQDAKSKSLEEEEELEYKTKDPIQKFQFAYNSAICMSEKFPENLLDARENVSSTEKKQ